jgi:tetratricopeptide (TPR) repeat protein
MEKNVYPLKKVGKFFNEHFIPVKVQMDQTDKDNQNVRNWYGDAKQIEKEFNIDAYPTYLFLSPEGKPLHRASGGFSPDKFLSIAAEALSPETQSYTLIAKYDAAKMDTAELKQTAIALRRSAPEFASKLAFAYFQKLSSEELSKDENLGLLIEFSTSPVIQEFVESYIGRLTKSQMFEKKHIDLITRFLNSSKSRGFKFLYENPVALDSVMNSGRELKSWFAKNFIDYVIYQEEVEPIAKAAADENKTPDWKKLMTIIKAKYNNEYADRIVIIAKKRWYGTQKDYEAFCRYTVEYMDKYGLVSSTDWDWNENAWMIFKFSKDKGKLEKALQWSNKAVNINPSANWMDTYANILYKLGKKAHAIRWEQVAAKLDQNDPEIQANLTKMKNGEPTWPQTNNPIFHN